MLIDTDVQCNSSDTYRAKIKDTATLYDVLLDDDRIKLYEAIQHTEMGDIVASDPLLRRLIQFWMRIELMVYFA